jgi:hypothetical protein
MQINKIIVTIICVALGSIFIGILTNKYIVGICLCSVVGILSNVFRIKK